MADRLERELFALRNGDITFARFASNVREDVDRIARSLMRRFDLPSFVDEDDMRQEALIGVWRAFETWDSAKGGLRNRAVYCACDRVRKAIRKARSEDRKTGHGRYDMVQKQPELVRSRSSSSVRTRGLVPEKNVVAPSAERISILMSELRERLTELGQLGEVATEALLEVGGSIDEAAVIFLLDPRNTEVTDKRRARDYVRSVAARLAA